MEPKAAKGGTFSTLDIEMIKNILFNIISETGVHYTDTQLKEMSNLLHRLNRIETK